MSVTDILTRANTIYKKYEKYDVDKKSEQTINKNDRFLQEYTELQADVEAAIQKSSDASIEKNRAVIATLNAEIRRAKEAMRAKLPKLTKHAPRKVKGVTPEDIALRPDMVLAITAKIEEIPDGIVLQPKVKGKGLFSKSSEGAQEIKIDATSPDDIVNAGQGQHSEESEKFSQEVQERKTKQDQSLDIISEGLTTLGNMAQDINEELDRQAPLVDEIDTKVNKAQTEMVTTNTRLKGMLLQFRSSRNIVVDIILLVVVLSIASVLYKVISDKKSGS
ncbi:unnamed protein product [Calypogeia fissa]